MRQPPIDPQTGRAAVVLAGLLGATAVVAYGAGSPHPRADVPSPPAAEHGVAGLGELVARAETARATLDVDAMARLANELGQFAESTTLATKSTAARLELVELYAAIALEASVRASVDESGREAANHAAARAITSARRLAAEIDDHPVDRARLDAALARTELAAGTDLTAAHPAVLLPTFRDPELRAAAIAEPLWRGREPAPSPELAQEILEQLRACERRTALVELLTADALLRAGQAEAARAAIEPVMQEVPQQPLAKALLRRLGGGTAIAAVVPSPAPAAVGEPIDAAGAEPTPRPVEPAPAPATPTPASAPAQTPVATADPPKPAATPKPATTPKPAATPKPDAGKKKDYDTLLSEGCKLVRSGQAEAGFEKLREAFDLNPNAVAVTVCMAEAHHALGRDASARALCERALRKSPNDRRARLLMAELEIARGNESAALEHYRKVLQNDPDDAKAKAYVDAHGG